MRFNFILISAFVFIFTGCYTQFASREAILPPDKVTMEVDSTGDTVKVIQRTDTVVEKEHENCIWERDMFGRPYLHCYDSYYPRDWYLYNNTPWWYRDDPFWYDYDRCPRYYHYDPTCNSCVHHSVYRHRFDDMRGNHSGSGISEDNSRATTPRSRSGGIPAGGSSIPMNGPSTSGSVTKNSTQPTLQQQSLDNQPVNRQRNAGIPAAITPPPAINSTSAQVPSPQIPNNQVQQQPDRPRFVDTSSAGNQPHRRNARSW